jgi:outer membrane protein assembly factor BamB
LRSPLLNLKWSFAVPKNEEIKYLTDHESLLLLTTKEKNSDKYIIRVIKKKKAKDINTFSFQHVMRAPEFVANNILIATRENSEREENNLYLINAVTGNLRWKDVNYNRHWPFYHKANSIFYVDKQGSLKNIDYSNKLPAWKLTTENGFKESTRPTLEGERFYICNGKDILVINAKNSNILHRFIAPEEAVYCSFKDNLTALVSEDDYIYLIDVEKALLMWRYKYVALFSNSIVDIIHDQYLALLNTVDLTRVERSKRAKIITNEDQVLHFLDLYTGDTLWQKNMKYPISIDKVTSSIKDKVLVIQTDSGSLTAFSLKTGNKLWRFYNKDKKTPPLTYKVKDEQVFVFVEMPGETILYIMDHHNGHIYDKIQIPNCRKDNIEPIIDERNIYLTCRSNILDTIKLPAIDKKETTSHKK